MIYFLRRADGAIKIGYTRGTGNGRKMGLEGTYGSLEMLGVHDGDLSTERSLHNTFAASCDFGEWFHPTPDLLDYIKENTFPPVIKPASARGLCQTYPKRPHEAGIRIMLRELMEYTGFTAGDVSSGTGISETIIGRYANNQLDRFNGDTLETLCKFFDCDIQDLLDAPFP